MGRRTGNDSRCSRQAGAPYRWAHEHDPEHPSVVELNSWLATLAPFARIHEEGEIDGLLEDAQFGRLWDTEDPTTKIKPIVMDPEVYELRHQALSKKLRFYHGEPAQAPDLLVGLHRHIKHDDSSQQQEIEHSVRRYQHLQVNYGKRSTRHTS